MTTQEKIKEVQGKLNQLVNLYNKNAENQNGLLKEITQLEGGLKILNELKEEADG